MSLQCPAPTTRSTPHLVQRQVLLLSQDLVAQLQLQGLKGVLARCWGEGSLQAGKQLQQLVAAAAARPCRQACLPRIHSIQAARHASIAVHERAWQAPERAIRRLMAARRRLQAPPLKIRSDLGPATHAILVQQLLGHHSRDIQQGVPCGQERSFQTRHAAARGAPVV